MPAAGDLCLVRTPWDYHLNPAGFLAVIENLHRQGVRIENPFTTLRWNMDKIYLSELETRGASIVPSYFFARPEGLGPEEFVQKVTGGKGESQSMEWILKPRIGAGAEGVQRLSAEAVRNMLDHIQREPHILASLQEVFLQPFVEAVKTEGEVSLIYYRLHNEPVFSHAVLKLPKGGEFRVQNDFGGSQGAFHPSKELKAWSEDLLQSLPHPWVYARVDVLQYSYQPLLGELEMVEPQLFHTFGTRSEELLCQALQPFPL